MLAKKVKFDPLRNSQSGGSGQSTQKPMVAFYSNINSLTKGSIVRTHCFLHQTPPEGGLQDGGQPTHGPQQFGHGEDSATHVLHQQVVHALVIGDQHIRHASAIAVVVIIVS
jgi:hypothetical protein